MTPVFRGEEKTRWFDSGAGAWHFHFVPLWAINVILVIARKAGQAIHILDQFHIVVQLNRALDEITLIRAPHAAACVAAVVTNKHFK
jgi:hypothetical protein